MKHALWKVLIILCIAIGILAGVICMNYRQVNLKPGNMANLESQTVYGLTAFSLSGSNCYEMKLDTTGMSTKNDAALIFVNFTVFQVYVNGELLHDSSEITPASNVIVCSFPTEDPNSTRLHLTIVADNWPLLGKVYLGQEGPCKSYIKAYNMLRVFSFGLLTAMFLYGFSLFINKRNERYLLDFIFYTGIMCLWYIWNASFNTQQFWFGVARNIFNTITLMLSIRLTLRILQPKPNRWAYKAFSIAGISISTVFFAVLNLVSYRISVYAGNAFFLISIIFLVYDCLKCNCGNLHLLIGLVITQELRLFTRMSPLVGSFYLSATSGAPVYDLPFALMFMLVINKKYSDKFKSYEQLNFSLQKSNEYLDNMVEERTANIKVEQEQRYNLMLNVFHDLRSPLFIMKGYLEQLDLSVPNVDKQLDIIKGRLNFIIHLSEDLFLTAKLEGRHLMFIEENFDLSALIQELADASQLDIHKKRIELICKIEKASGYVWGDSHRIEQAIQNIINNAINYTPESGTIYLSVLYGQSEATVLVKDTGKGICESDLPKVFTRYYRAGKKDKSTSSGLGLSIAYEIVTQQRGQIDVLSQVGKGTIFRVNFPYSKFSDSGGQTND